MTSGGTPKSEIFSLEESLPLFRAFDSAVEAESGRAAPKDFDESRDRLMGLIDALPQRAAIRSEDATRWLDRTMRMAHDRMELEHGEGGADIANIHEHTFWHIRRASGIGGSEAATVLKHYRGERGTFGDAHNLVKEKLLILAPQKSTEEMARGVRAEPWIQRIYHETNGTDTDHKSLDKLRGFRWDKRPASIGTPDEIVVLETGKGRKRRVIDYKAPSAAVMEDYEKNGVSFDYVCQLHHYSIIAMAAGVRVDELAIDALDPRSFTIMNFPVEFDIELAKEMASTAHHLWHANVMMGVVPEAPRPDELDVEDEALIQIGIEAAMLKVLEDEMKKRHTDLRNRISEMGAEWHDIATGKMDLKVGSFSRDRIWDEETIRDLAERAGLDPSEFEKVDAKKLDQGQALPFLKDLFEALQANEDPSALLDDFSRQGVPHERKLDMKALADRLEEMDVSTVTAARVRESFRLSTKKKGPEAERLSHLRAEVADLADGIEAIFNEKAPRILSGEIDEEPTAEELEI